MMGDNFWKGLADRIGVNVSVAGRGMVRASAAASPSESYEFHMTNLPDSPWKTYYVLSHEDDGTTVFSSLPPDQMQYQAEHVRYSQEELQSAISEGRARKSGEAPNRIDVKEAKAAGFFKLAKPMGWGLYRVEDIDGGMGSIWSIEKDAETGGQFLVKKTDSLGEIMRLKTASAKTATIVKEDGGYEVQSESGKNLGDEDTKGEAEKRLRQVEYFKHHKGSASVQRVVTVASDRKYNQCDKMVGDDDKKCGKPVKVPGHRCDEHPMKKIWPGDDDETGTKHCPDCDGGTKPGEHTFGCKLASRAQRTAIAPPGEGKLVKKLKGEESVENPWAVAWSIHNKKKAALKAKVAAGELPEGELPEGTNPHLGEHGIVSKPKVFSEPDLDPMTKMYLGTALWSSHDNADDSGGEPLDANYSIEDIHPASVEKAKADCASFREKAGDLLVGLEDIRNQGDIMSSVGHDFWLTRNGHGAGFWDGDYPEAVGEALTKLSKEFGGQDIYVGDDGSIYLSGAEPPRESVEEKPIGSNPIGEEDHGHHEQASALPLFMKKGE